MKKMLLIMGMLISVAPVMGQEAKVDDVSNSIYQELTAQPQSNKSFVQRLLDWRKAVDYLEGARDCLSGIGCSKRQSYLANYLLGAAYGFAQSLAFKALESQNTERWYNKINFDTGRVEPGLGAKLVILNILVNELGYRYLVKEKVSLFRCLTFRGCTDQTKRYAFYNLGIWSGRIGSALALAGATVVRMKLQERYIPVSDDVKKVLDIEKGGNEFLWYEVLGFKRAPSKRTANLRYRQRALKFHPDKAPNPGAIPVYTEVMVVLNAAKDKGGF